MGKKERVGEWGQRRCWCFWSSWTSTLREGLHRTGSRRLRPGTWREVPAYALDTNEPGDEVAGPDFGAWAWMTVLVRRGDRPCITPHGWLDIRAGNGIMTRSLMDRSEQLPMCEVHLQLPLTDTVGTDARAGRCRISQRPHLHRARGVLSPGNEKGLEPPA